MSTISQIKYVDFGLKFHLKVITEISLSYWFRTKSIDYGLYVGRNYFCVTEELRIVYIFKGFNTK